MMYGGLGSETNEDLTKKNPYNHPWISCPKFPFLGPMGQTFKNDPKLAKTRFYGSML